MDLSRVLTAYGIEHRDARVPSVVGEFHPVGVVLHHTASHPSTATMSPSLRVVTITGNAHAPAPLCNVLVDRAGTVWLVTDGKANDSGMGSGSVLDRIRRNLAPVADARMVAPVSETNGNAWFYDIEIENDGLEEPWSIAVVEVACRVAAALCAENAWTADHVLLHREWTARKTDPNYGTGGEWRAWVHALLEPIRAASTTSPPTEDEMPVAIMRYTPTGHVFARFASGHLVWLTGAELGVYQATQTCPSLADFADDADFARLMAEVGEATP